MAKFENIYGNTMDDILVATQTSDGLMSKEDKIKLDTILDKLDSIQAAQERIEEKLKTAVFIKQE